MCFHYSPGFRAYLKTYYNSKKGVVLAAATIFLQDSVPSDEKEPTRLTATIVCLCSAWLLFFLFRFIISATVAEAIMTGAHRSHAGHVGRANSKCCKVSIHPSCFRPQSCSRVLGSVPSSRYDCCQERAASMPALDAARQLAAGR
jgi:hypothetical protein